MTLHIDGTMPTGELDGSAVNGPWAVFDDEKQDWVKTNLPFRWMAALLIRKLCKKH